jgi:hypothetical protein
LIAGLSGVLTALPAQAQPALDHRVFPATALRGELLMVAPPQVRLNGQDARLAPGARIRGADNMLLLPASAAGARWIVNYTVEATTGLLMDVWVLRPVERANQPWPVTPEQAGAWQFDVSAQRWSRP